ncbi:helix-turn-helix domain-containing protein [Bacteroidota bacterium]
MEKEPESISHVITFEEAALFLRVSARDVEALVARGVLKGITIAGKTRVIESTVHTLVRRYREKQIRKNRLEDDHSGPNRSKQYTAALEFLSKVETPVDTELIG